MLASVEGWLLSDLVLSNSGEIKKWLRGVI
jgi:hypothetical protein